MYNINYSKINKNLYFGLLFIFLGLILSGVFISVFTSEYLDTLNYDSNTTGYASAQKKAYGYEYNYSVKGNIYTCESKKQKAVDEINVYYKLSNPEECYIYKLTIFDVCSMLIVVLPLMLTIYGIKLFLSNMKEKHKLHSLEKCGILYKELSYKVINEKKNGFVAKVTINTSAGVKQLESECIEDKSNIDKYKTIDLLYDENTNIY